MVEVSFSFCSDFEFIPFDHVLQDLCKEEMILNCEFIFKNSCMLGY